MEGCRHDTDRGKNRCTRRKRFHCHFDDHKFNKNRFGNETRLPQKTPGVWLTAWAMTGHSYIICSYHHHLSDKLVHISIWLSPRILQLQERFELPQFSCLWFCRISSKWKMHIFGDTINHFFMPLQPLVGLSILIFDISRPHSDTPQSVGLLWTSDRPKQRTLTTHNTPKRQMSICPAGFEPAISARERQQIHALERTATGIVRHHFRRSNSVAIM